MRILIIGATGGIGEASARLFSGHATELWIHGRSIEALQPLAWELRARPVVADLGSKEAVRAMMESAGPLDGLLYAAGAVVRQPLRQTEDSAWRAVWDANFDGARHVLQYARWNPGARALFLGVYPDYVRIPGFGAYAASKAALEALLEIARRELRAEGLRLLLVRLPAVRTRLWTPIGSPPRNALEPSAVAQRLLELLLNPPADDVIPL